MRLLVSCLILVACLHAEENLPPALRGVGIDQKLNQLVPLNLTFHDEHGRSVALRDYFHQRPVILSLVYYDCPMLCTLVLNGLVRSLRGMSLQLGQDYDVITVSFNPSEGPSLAAAKKRVYLDRYARKPAEGSWHFLTGEESAIRSLTNAVGFRYAFDKQTQQYVHASGIMVLTPNGTISRYFYGIDYSPRDLRLGLVEASNGKIGTPVDQLLLFCYHYDPATGKYGAAVMNALRIGGIGTLIALAVFVLISLRRDRRAGGTILSVPGNKLLAATFPLFPPSGSVVAERVDYLYFFLIAVTLLFTSIIFCSVLFFAIRYRRRRPDELPRPVDGSVPLEVVWIAIPSAIAMVIFLWGAGLYFRNADVPPGALDVYVVGKQWMWKLQHTEGQREINELHVPVGRPVKLTMTSQDTIHSFYVPAFRIKQDVLPGRYTSMWFQPEKTGIYHLFCAEYCGNQHSGMVGRVVVMEPAEYQNWLSGAVPGESMAASGERVFQRSACINCHHPDGRGRAPSVVGIFGKTVRLQSGASIVADEAYIRESILNPSAKIVAGYPNIMPTFQGLISEEGLMELVAYIKSLQTGESAK